MYCNKCGNELKEGALFCTKCGNEIAKKEVRTPIEPAKLKGATPTKKEKGDPVVLILIILIIIMLIIGIGLGAFYIATRNGDSDSKSSSIVSSSRIEEEDEESSYESEDDESEDESSEEIATEEETDIEPEEEALPDTEPLYMYVRDDNETDYSNEQVLDYLNYVDYNGGYGKFYFCYPGSIFTSITETMPNSSHWYGRKIKEVTLSCTDGSFVNLILTEKDYNIGPKDMADIVRSSEGDSIKGQTINSLYERPNGEYSVLISGYTTDDRTCVVYNLALVDENYVYQMKIYYPTPVDDEDKKHKDYYVECMYRMCGFSGSSERARSYADFLSNY